MPIFEYRCQSCDSQFEKIIFRQTEPIHCPECAGTDVAKLLSSFAVKSKDSTQNARQEAGPCPCGAPRRGMCGSLN